MRRRWRWQWGEAKAAIQILAGCWFVSGFGTFIVLALAYRSHDRRGHDSGAAWAHSPIRWELPLWFAPYTLVALAAVLIWLPRGFCWLWRNPPIRRATEPVTEDLRERYPPPMPQRGEESA